MSHAIYNHKLWKKRSMNQRKRVPYCEVCYKKTPRKLTVTNLHADHVKPWQTMKDFFNGRLQTLCHNCHMEKTFLYDFPNKVKQKKTEMEFF